MSERETTHREGIQCPYCGHCHTEGEDWHEHVTYWGEVDHGDSRVEFRCHSCEKDFTVEESVTRTWTSREIAGDDSTPGEAT